MPTPLIAPGFASPRRRGTGALLLVVLIAMLIILLLYFGGGNKSYMNQVQNTRKQGKQMAQDINTDQLVKLILIYRDQNNGALPKTWEEIDAPAESYTDPWGKPMKFTCEEDQKTRKVVVRFHSDGPDGEAGTPDDINRSETLPY